ncbi:YcnI family protein [Streptomyces sp. Act143]|uniref:YcnI family protein n=1 Tax=Streptomyces sp. Act143 TaxID=2200760 RepID=UPI00215AFF17|nr:YcnI family protein [Streptomyces sp. Act143]
MRRSRPTRRGPWPERHPHLRLRGRVRQRRLHTGACRPARRHRTRRRRARRGPPRGWKPRTAADGCSVAGPALRTEVDVVHKVRIRRLPDAGQLVFKTVDTYGDGEIARWIEPSTGGAEPERPAPVLKLKRTTTAAATSAGPAHETAAARSGGVPAVLIAVPFLLGAGPGGRSGGGPPRAAADRHP